MLPAHPRPLLIQSELQHCCHDMQLLQQQGLLWECHHKQHITLPVGACKHRTTQPKKTASAQEKRTRTTNTQGLSRKKNIRLTKDDQPNTKARKQAVCVHYRQPTSSNALPAYLRTSWPEQLS
jgi:hypothetical protein